jgi:hypothetical protein
MAGVPVTISGVLYDKTARTQRPVLIIGEASLTGLSVGGGPVFPDETPPGIWGPTDPRPSHPIAPGGPPPGIWGGGGVPMPTPPIYIPVPPEPEEPPAAGDGGNWEYTLRFGWVWVPTGGGGKPHPPADPNAPVATPYSR